MMHFLLGYIGDSQGRAAANWPPKSEKKNATFRRQMIVTCMLRAMLIIGPELCFELEVWHDSVLMGFIDFFHGMVIQT